MPRWPEDSRRRMIDAAIELFAERGYAGSTVEDIARRAGVTPRTFFRYFDDKEEVLFGDADELLPILLGAIADGSGPVRAESHMQKALSTIATVMESRRGVLRERQRIIDSEIALSGRDLAKQALWQQRVAETLVERGFPADQSDVLASIGFALFRRSMHAWLAEESGPALEDRVRDALTRVRSVMDVSSSR